VGAALVLLLAVPLARAQAGRGGSAGGPKRVGVVEISQESVPRRPGAAARNSIGIGVLGGVLTATFIGIFMVPAFYVVERRTFGGATKRSPA
jgi:multidrug efflux pump subunit AcrB